MATERRPVVGVFPAARFEERSRLFAALAGACAVEFRPGDVAPQELDAMISWDPGFGERMASSVPAVLCYHDGSSGAPGPMPVRFAEHVAVPVRLRGRTLVEEAVGLRAGLVPQSPGEVLAATEVPVWTRRLTRGGIVDATAASPPELALGGRLKDGFRSRAFFSLLPTWWFLAMVGGIQHWTSPRVHAAITIDDPNLRRIGYGYLRFDELARHAASAGYHAAVGIVARDASVSRHAAVDVFRSARQLSLVVHGNDHVKAEFARATDEIAALSIAAQAWRRTASLKARWGLPIEPVVVPPHGACSAAMQAALRRVGFEGICYSELPRSDDVPALDGWRIDGTAELAGIHRLPLSAPMDELVLRATLGQPLVFTAHHTDLASGFTPLESAVAAVAAAGGALWCSPGAMFRSSVATLHDGDQLRVRSYATRSLVDVHPSAGQVVVESAPGPTVHLRSPDGESAVSGRVGDVLAVSWSGKSELSVTVGDEVDPALVPSPRWTPWPAVRRALTEFRDRSAPLLRPRPGGT